MVAVTAVVEVSATATFFCIGVLLWAHARFNRLILRLDQIVVHHDRIVRDMDAFVIANRRLG